MIALQPSTLADSREAIFPAMAAAVRRLGPEVRPVVEHHLGWLDGNGHPVPGAGGGKALRATLALLSAEAVGSPPVVAVPGAVAVELVHNFSLLHDDVIDGDRTRRHRPTAWSVFGAGQAILTGDALLSLAYDVLAGSAHPAAAAAASRLRYAFQRLIEGQFVDIALERPEQVDRVEMATCEAMASDKTAALLDCACALGALFGGGTPTQVAHLAAFGRHLGLAFQHADDLLGIWGDPAVTGKPVHSDLRNRKKSLPVVAALRSGTQAGQRLAELYRGELSEVDTAVAAQLVETAGGREWSEYRASREHAAALAALTSAAPAEPAHRELALLARLAVDRDY